MTAAARPVVSTIVLMLLLFALGTAYCLYYGRIGYMPQDHSAVFDGGWRVLSGQVPFRDFTAPNAIVPVLLQAGFFALLGVSWFTYTLHAAVFNGLFCTLVFLFLRMLGGTRPLSFFYGLLSGVVFYPPFGIPVQDQHAYFFTFLLVVLACWSVRSRRSLVKRASWFLLPLVAGVALLSKQIPTIFGVALGAVILIVGERRDPLALARGLLAGTAVTLLSLLAACLAWGVDSRLVAVYFFRLPAETGRGRLAAALSGRLTKVLRHMVENGELFFPFAVVSLVFLGGLFLLGAQYFTSAKGQGRTPWGGPLAQPFPLVVLAQIFVLICILYASLTNNEYENGVPLMFASLGLVHVSLQAAWAAEENGLAAGGRKQRRALPVVTSLLLYGSSLWCAANFDAKVNATRMVHNMVYRAAPPDAARPELPGPLSFLVWATPKGYRATPADFARVVEFFRLNPGTFFLVGDSSILYALTGRPSVNPVLWFHYGQTLPWPRSPLFDGFQHRLMNALRKHRVRYVVVEAVRSGFRRDTTWSRVSLADLVMLNELVQRRGVVRDRIGPFTILELNEGAV